jgi:hypothetical protein
MSNDTTPNQEQKSAGELSKKEVAEKVVTPKRQYFFPDYGRTVEVEDTGNEHKNIENATRLAKKEAGVKESDNG